MRVIVVGSGLAGLTAALVADEHGHDVTVITKGLIQSSNTAWAQGGVAVASGANDSPQLHADDTMRASAGTSDPLAVDVLTAEGMTTLHWLRAHGVQFDVDDQGRLERAREAAHSVARVVHSGGDATGAEIERALVDAVHASRIRVVEETALEDIIVTAGRANGVITLSRAGERQEWRADAVILATGGAGQLYQHTTNPLVATADGIAAALRAGVVVDDLEFMQFHPTALLGESVSLISEAVRGDGAVLRNRSGERFMTAVHVDAELAPRDVVARAIATEMDKQDGEAVWLDATVVHPGKVHGKDYDSLSDYLSARFPSITAACAAAGIDWSRQWVPVTPAAHYLMGGICTDLDGKTSLPGLWAVGEVARTGVHGANRLASNSLLEAAVFGRRAADSLNHESAQWPVFLAEPEVGGEASAHQTDSFNRSRLQRLMWQHAGLVRDADGLTHAANVISQWRRSLPIRKPASVNELEDRNLLEVAAELVDAARRRTHSLGAHFRSDDVNPVSHSHRKEPVHA